MLISRDTSAAKMDKLTTASLYRSGGAGAVTVSGYLARIGCDLPARPTAETLRSLHRAHLLTVPFENLDIHMGRPIILDEAAFYRKVVNERRGGFCYELNGLFGWLKRVFTSG